MLDAEGGDAHFDNFNILVTSAQLPNGLLEHLDPIPHLLMVYIERNIGRVRRVRLHEGALGVLQGEAQGGRNLHFVLQGNFIHQCFIICN